MDVAFTMPTPEETNDIHKETSGILPDQALWIPFCARPDNLTLHTYRERLEQNSYLTYIFTANRLRKA